MSWRRAVSSLLLLGAENRRLDIAVTVTAAVLVAVSRFSVLASGPWEWDETLFARGILDFNLAAHFPHPPGFPGWLAIGHLLLPLAGEPLVALQWASAAFSVLALWPLVVLGRKVAAPAVAVGCALLVLALPGPWLYAVRGFSSTAAGVLALSAAAVAVGGVAGRRLTAFSLLITAAVLVRPILVPPLAILWIGVVIPVRPRRRLLPGVLAAAALGVLAVLVMAWAEGGWGAFVEAFVRHGSRHFSRLVHNPGGLAELGLVKGLGGVWWSGGIMLASALGLGVWWRRVGWRSAVLWVVVLAVALAQLMWLQNRTYGRYAVPVQMAAAPLLAGVVGLAPPVAATAVVAVAIGAVGWCSWPLLVEQHERLMPGWQAVLFAAETASERGLSVVVEPELHPFASYRWHLLERAGAGAPPLVLSPWAPEPWQGVAGDYLVATVHPQLYLPSLSFAEWRWGGVSDRLEPLTQQRFLEAEVSMSPPLPLGRWWAVESTEGGDEFMWAGRDAALLLPPLPAHASVMVDLQVSAGDSPLEVKVNDRLAISVGADDGRRRLALRSMNFSATSANRLQLARSGRLNPHSNDARELSVQLFAVSIVRPDRPWAVPEATERALAMAGVEIEGGYAGEHFGDDGFGVWLAPHATIIVPAREGRLFLRLWAPRPTPPETRAMVAGVVTPVAVVAGGVPQESELAIDGSQGLGSTISLELESTPYCPYSAGAGDDRRQLGVVLLGLRFLPATSWTGLDGADGAP